MKSERKEELCVKLVIYKNHPEMHGQQNMKLCKDRLYFDQFCGSPRREDDATVRRLGGC